MIKLDNELKKLVADYKGLQDVYNQLDNYDFNNINVSDLLDDIMDKLNEIEETSILKIIFMDGNTCYFLGDSYADLQGIFEDEVRNPDCILNLYDWDYLAGEDEDYINDYYILLDGGIFTDNAFKSDIEDLLFFDIIDLI